MGLGPLRDVGLAEARELAGAARALIRNNIDPIEHRITERAEVKADAAGAISFEPILSHSDSIWSSASRDSVSLRCCTVGST
jgi:hypothetical protein